jgi:hypothetical protein
MGRPRTKLHSEDYLKIEALAARGCGHTAIARAIGIDAKTFRARLKDDAEAAAAYGDGKSEEEAHLVSLLRKKAEDGDAPSAMFLLKSRHGYRDRGDTDTGAQPGVQVTISLPASLDPAAYARLIEAVPVDRGANALSSPVEAA